MFLRNNLPQGLLSGWKQIFPDKFKTELESLTFTKKLMTATISNILFVRNIFGDDAFAKKSLDGIPLRILKEKSSDPRAKSFANWLVGAFDALKKKYLRGVTLVILLDPASQEDAHEAYSIKVTYPGGLPSCEVVGTILGQVQNSTKNLLQAILMLTEGLDPLPETAYIALRLSYYDENTPEDYEPRGFQSAEKELVLPAASSRVKFGKVSTVHHCLTFNMHAKPGSSSQEDQVLNDQALHSQMSQSQSQLVQGEMEHLQQVEEVGENDEDVAEEGEVDEEMLVEGDDGERESVLVMCSCGGKERNEQMLLCQHCGHEQHLACYKLLPGEKSPSVHCCLPCSLQGEGRVCTDPKLGKIASKKGLDASVLANTMIFRRVLAALSLCKTVSREWLQELGLADSHITSIAEKLLGDGIVQEGGKVDRSVLEEAVQKHFGRRATKRSRDEEVETMLRRATDGLHIGEGNGVRPSGDKRGGDGSGAGTGAGHGVDEPQLAGGGDGGQEHGKERKRRRVSRTRGE